MRYDTPIYFQKVLSGAYDPETGNYQEDQVTEEQRLASVACTSIDTMQIVYGGIHQGSVTVHLQNHYEKPYDRIRIGDKVYRVEVKKNLRTKQILILTGAG